MIKKRFKADFYRGKLLRHVVVQVTGNPLTLTFLSPHQFLGKDINMFLGSLSFGNISNKCKGTQHLARFTPDCASIKICW